MKAAIRHLVYLLLFVSGSAVLVFGMLIFSPFDSGSAIFVTCAFADETDNNVSSLSSDSENVVNPQQLPDSSFIYDTSITDLDTADAYYDGQTVQVTGEVIGDNIAASLDGGMRWITLASDDDSSTISVYMSADSASKIDMFGVYNSTGTTLQVQGTYNLACADHAGLSDLHAEVVTVVKKGHATSEKFDYRLFIPGGCSIVIGLMMLGLFYYLRERQR